MFALTLRYAAAMIQTDSTTVHLGDCLAVLRSDTLGYEWELGYAPPLIPDNSMDAVVTDPPYGLEFMGKEWDGADGFRRSLNPNDTGRDNAFGRTSRTSPQYRAGALFQEWCEAWVTECLRVLKPGGHLLAFGGSRTWHRLAVAVEDAGFEIRDSIAWLYGSGFPKSLDVSKAIDKMRVEDRGPMLRVREWLNGQRLARGFSLGQINGMFGLATNGGGNASNWTTHPTNIEIPSWDKWLTLKREMRLPDDMDAEVWRLNGRKGVPGDSWESREITGAHQQANPIGGYAHKFGVGTDPKAKERRDIPATPAAQQWQGWGTALKPAFEPIVVARKPLAGGTVAANVLAHGTGALNIDGCRVGTEPAFTDRPGRKRSGGIMGCDDGTRTTSGGAGRWPANVVLDESQAAALDQMSGTSSSGRPSPSARYGLHEDTGSNVVLGRGLSSSTPNVAPYGDSGGASRFFYVAKAPTRERPKVDGVAHPTVKPLALMRWLVRLVTPPGGTVLEPFAGSGTTVEACALEGFACIAIEREADYLPLIQARLARVEAVQISEPNGPSLFDMEETA